MVFKTVTMFYKHKTLKVCFDIYVKGKVVPVLN
jgi:hypothetical protein